MDGFLLRYFNHNLKHSSDLCTPFFCVQELIRQIVVLGESAHQKGLTSSKTRGSSCVDLGGRRIIKKAWKIHCRYTPSSNAVAEGLFLLVSTRIWYRQ